MMDYRKPISLEDFLEHSERLDGMLVELVCDGELEAFQRSVVCFLQQQFFVSQYESRQRKQPTLELMNTCVLAELVLYEWG